MSRRAKYCFLMERQVGIGSAAGAIEPHVKRLGHRWLDVTYSKPNGLLERIPLPDRVRGTLRGVLQTSAALREGPYAGLCFLTHNPAVFQPRALARIPTLLWTDVTPAQLDGQAESYAHPVDRVPLLSRVKNRAVARTFRAAKRCVGWSEWARRSFVDDYGVAVDRTRVVPPGIDLELWRPCVRESSPDSVRLLFVGGHFRRKGGELLLEVFRQHFRGRCELDLVTRDPVPDEPGVTVHRGLSAGSPRLLDLYRNASAFVLPTYGDCYSIASIEAMASGLPVVVSDIGGIADIVEHERSGYLIPVADGAALRQAVEGLLADPSRRLAMGARGRAIVEQRYDSARTAASLLGQLDEIANER